MILKHGSNGYLHWYLSYPWLQDLSHNLCDTLHNYMLYYCIIGVDDTGSPLEHDDFMILGNAI